MKKSKLIALSLITILMCTVSLPTMAQARVITNLNKDSFQSITYSQHTSQTHTKEDIKQKYNNTLTYDYTKSMYKQTPSNTAPYSAGSLQDGVINDTLSRINFYRWLYGVDSVTINTDKMERNQKGAVVLSANDVLTHYPDKPSDMDTAFYEEAYDGCNAKGEEGDTYSGNCSYGDLYMYEAVDGYIHDIYNVSVGGGAVGHRMSLLDPYATQTSFGKCNEYSTLSMYYDFDDVGAELPEDFYAYPSAGYFPLEQFYTNQYWSLYVTEDLVITDNFKIQFTYNGKKYDAVGITTERSWPAIDFKMPDELIALLGGTGKNIKESDIDVLVTGLDNSKGDKITYSYTVNFFSINEKEKLPYILGDITQDGNVTTKDARQLFLYVAGEIMFTDEQKLAGDVTGDNNITTKDARQLFLYVAGEISGF